MTADEFKAALALTKMSIDGRATYGALLALVDKLPVREARARAGCSRQAVDAAMRQIVRATKRCPRCGAVLKRLKRPSIS